MGMRKKLGWASLAFLAGCFSAMGQGGHPLPTFDTSDIFFIDKDTSLLTAGTYPNRGGRIVIRSLDNVVEMNFDGHHRTVGSAAISPDGTTIVSCGDYWAFPELFIWKRNSPSESETLVGHKVMVSDIAFSRDGTMFATGGGPAGGPYDPGEAIIWDFKSRKPLHNLPGHSGMVFAVTFSPDGTRLATGSADEKVRIWNVADGTLLKTLSDPAGRVTSLEFSPDGKKLAAGVGRWGEAGQLALWETEHWESIVVKPSEHWINAIAWSPDGSKIVAGGGGGSILQLLDVAAHTWSDTLLGVGLYDDEVFSLAISSDGTKIAVGAQGQDVRLLDWPDASDQEKEDR